MTNCTAKRVDRAVGFGLRAFSRPRKLKMKDPAERPNQLGSIVLLICSYSWTPDCLRAITLKLLLLNEGKSNSLSALSL